MDSSLDDDDDFEDDVKDGDSKENNDNDSDDDNKANNIRKDDKNDQNKDGNDNSDNIDDDDDDEDGYNDGHKKSLNPRHLSTVKSDKADALRETKVVANLSNIQGMTAALPSWFCIFFLGCNYRENYPPWSHTNRNSLMRRITLNGGQHSDQAIVHTQKTFL